MGRQRREHYGPDVPRRAWTRSERRVVLRGFFGRLVIAVEALVFSIFFTLLPIGLFLRHQEAAALLAPIFGIASLAFLVYTIWLMAPPTHAVMETFAPIYTVDGYIRYRMSAKGEPEYYVAALRSDRTPLGEWPLRQWPKAIGTRETWPVLVEFSRYGGIHKIDGRSTGVLPDDITPFGVGIARGQDESRFG